MARISGDRRPATCGSGAVGESSTACGQNPSNMLVRPAPEQDRVGPREALRGRLVELRLRHDPVQVPVGSRKVPVRRHAVERHDPSHGLHRLVLRLVRPSLSRGPDSAARRVFQLLRRSSRRPTGHFLSRTYSSAHVRHALLEKPPLGRVSRERERRSRNAPAPRRDSRGGAPARPSRPDRTDSWRAVRDRRSRASSSMPRSAPSRCAIAIARLSATTGDGAMVISRS